MSGGTVLVDDLGKTRYEVTPLAIETEYGSDIDATSDDITQETEKYRIPTKIREVWYELRYEPVSIVRAVNGNGATLKVSVTYPK